MTINLPGVPDAPYKSMEPEFKLNIGLHYISLQELKLSWHHANWDTTSTLVINGHQRAGENLKSFKNV